ncbi:MAG: hypothetical protein JWO97_4640 [Acidobacteria bacterium]|nr:hypothetical protein [Acidobacteriota bacterium]
MIAILLLISATFHPAQPAVGDLITVDFEQAPVVLNASPEYELVSQQGKRVVIRTFKPRPFALSGVSGDVAFRNMIVPVRSVIAPNDPMTPAPLKPPRAEPYERLPFIAIGIAALAAAAAWYAAMRMSKRAPAATSAMATLLSPDERFRRAVESLLSRPQPLRWAALADAVRAYLAATSAASADMTTTEVLARIDRPEIATILSAGDIEKFSTDEVARDDFETIARRALELAA